jgi:hypothetical protein
VRAFIDRLPQPLGTNCTTTRAKPPEARQRSLEAQPQNRTFHYPYPTSRYPADAELTPRSERSAAKRPTHKPGGAGAKAASADRKLRAKLNRLQRAVRQLRAEVKRGR